MDLNEARILDGEALERALATLPEWRLENGRLWREFRFPDFVRAFGFMTQVALVAEAMGHHPDWCNAYDRVRVELITHEVGGVTERDLRLAREMDAIAARLV